MNATLIGLALVLAAPAPKEAPKETPTIEGQWTVESFEGPKGPPKKDTMIFSFAGGKITITEGGRGKAEDAAYTVDMKKTPIEIDIMPERGGKGEVVKGIIEVKGDTMKLCFTDGKADRPKEFKGGGDVNAMMITLKRVKEEKK